MGPEAFAQYNAKLRTMIVSTHGLIQTLIPNASLQSALEKPPAWSSEPRYLLPGRGPGYTSITTNEFLPALKKAGVVDSWMFAAELGEVRLRNGRSSRHRQLRAQLDQPTPLMRALGSEAAQKLHAEDEPPSPRIPR